MWFQSSRQLLSALWGTLWILLSTVIISAAVVVVLLRATSSSAALFQPQITQWMERQLGAHVEIGVVALELDGRYLTLQLEQVALRSPEGQAPKVGFERSSIQFDLLASLRHGVPVTSHLIVHRPRLHLQHAVDGSLMITGGEIEQGGDASLIGGWLLSQPNLSVSGAEIHIQETRFANLQWLLSEVELSLVNSGYRHQATGSAVLNGERASPIELQLEWFGDLHNPEGWDGQMYLRGDALHLQDLLGKGDQSWGALTQGEADLKLWGEWLSGQLERGRASLQRDDKYMGAPGLAGGEFHWNKQNEQAWRLQMEQLVWGGGQEHERKSHPSSAVVEYQVGPAGEERLMGAVDHVRLVSSPELSGLYATVAHGESGVLVAGDLHQVKFRSLPDERGLFSGIEARMELDELSVAGTGRMKDHAVAGINGLLHFNERQGYFAPDSGIVRMATGGLYSKPLALNLQQGLVHWEQHPKALLVTLDRLKGVFQNIAFNGGVQLLNPASGSPVLNMRLGVSAPRVDDVVSELPASQMDPALMTWLQSALLSGEVSGGLVEIQGPLDRFPYSDGGGSFKATLDLKDLYLQYDEVWPAITHSQAQLNFDNDKLRVELQQGKLDGHPIHSVVANASTIGDGPVKIWGRIVSDSGKLLRTLEQTPIRQTATQLNRVINLEGYALLELDVVVPLTDDSTAVSGRVELHDNRLNVSEIDLNLEQLTGNLGFTGEGISIEGMRGEMLGGPLELTAFTAAEEERQQVVVGLNGVVFGEQVERWLGLDAPQRTLFESRSKTAWDGRLRIEEEKLELHLHSDLQGIALHAPAPLKKTVEERWPTTLTLKMQDDEVSQIQLSTPQRIKANLNKVALDQRSPAVWSGLIRLGDSVELEEAESESTGVELKASFERANLDAWYTLWKEKLDRGERSRFSSFNLKKMVISANEASLFEQTLNNLALVMRVDESGHWGIGVSSDQVEGSVRVPANVEEAMMVDLSYLQLGSGQPGEKKGTQSRPLVDPSQFPALQVKSEKTVINGIDFGRLELKTQPTQSGLLVDQAKLHSDVMKADAQGTWLQWGERARSRFIIDVEGDELGQILGQFGYGGEIDRGKSTIRIHAAWPDTPLDFDLKQMDGELKVAVEKGQLLDVDQGVGRVFGLLGVHTLVRRLTLDFSDITDKGFAFDTIAGSFKLDSGNAHTRDLVIDGPSATIRVEGRTGIVAQNYDQQVTVSPKISETLPATGALVGGPAGAAVGSVLLLYQKLFQEEGLASTRYRLTGSWAAPLLEEIKPKPPVTEPAFLE